MCRRTRTLAASILLPLALLVGCGDDDGDGGDDVQAYCALAATLEAQEEFATSEQLRGLVAAAPTEIEDDVRLVVDSIARMEAADDPEDAMAVFDEPEFGEAVQSIEAFEAENCDHGGGIAEDGSEDVPATPAEDGAGDEVEDAGDDEEGE
jgi:hypothetical protein